MATDLSVFRTYAVECRRRAALSQLDPRLRDLYASLASQWDDIARLKSEMELEKAKRARATSE
jgi:hypothetical protein